MEGEVLQCSCHGSQFDVRTGEVVSPPADEPLTRYTVRIEGDDILVGPGG
jgi:nitrite reductase/ring-hydroxylating ferredoxin subunit